MGVTSTPNLNGNYKDFVGAEIIDLNKKADGVTDIAADNEIVNKALTIPKGASGCIIQFITSTAIGGSPETKIIAKITEGDSGVTLTGLAASFGHWLTDGSFYSINSAHNLSSAQFRRCNGITIATRVYAFVQYFR